MVTQKTSVQKHIYVHFGKEKEITGEAAFSPRMLGKSLPGREGGTLGGAEEENETSA